MKKTEVLTTLNAIAMYYPNFKVGSLEETTDAWHLLLQDSEDAVVTKNLIEHIRTNRFPPTIADLLKLPEARDRAIPTAAETIQMLNAPAKEPHELLQNTKNTDTMILNATRKQAETAKTETRILLGLGGEEPHE